MRKTGYYWVQIDNEWSIAKWNHIGRIWKVEGMTLPWEDEQFGEIDETPITRTSLVEQHKATRGAAIDVVNDHFHKFQNTPIKDRLLETTHNEIIRDIHNLPQSPITKYTNQHGNPNV